MTGWFDRLELQPVAVDSVQIWLAKYAVFFPLADRMAVSELVDETLIAVNRVTQFAKCPVQLFHGLWCVVSGLYSLVVVASV